MAREGGDEETEVLRRKAVGVVNGKGGEFENLLREKSDKEK